MLSVDCAPLWGDTRFESFVERIITKCKETFSRHDSISCTDILDDVRYRRMVSEMLDTMDMARSTMQLYLEDTGEVHCNHNVSALPIRDAHRRQRGRLYSLLEEQIDKNKIQESDKSADLVNSALRLCKLEGLLEESVNDKNELGESKIFEAAADDWKPSHIKLLVTASADVNARDSKGNTPIIKAAQCGHAVAVRELGLLGANVDEANNDGWTALTYAASIGHNPTVNVLGSLGVKMCGDTSVIIAAKRGHTATVKALLSLKADPNIFDDKGDNKGWTALMWACWHNFPTIVQELLLLGADVNAVQSPGAEFEGCPALVQNARRGNVDILKILHSHGANLNLVGSNRGQHGITAIGVAKQAGHLEYVEMLHSLGVEK